MMKKNKVYLKDTVEGLSTIEDKSADIIIIDPPYNIGKLFGSNYDNLEIEDYIKWSKLWIDESLRIIKPQGSIFIYGFSEILSYLLIHNVSKKINRRWLVWHYMNRTSPNSKDWQRSHESILLLWKENRIFNLDDIREPYINNKSNGKIRPGTTGRFGSKESIYNYHENGALPRDVIKIPTLAGGAGNKERVFLCKECDNIFYSKEFHNHKKHETVVHPTQKPMKLTEKLLLSSIPKNIVPYIVVPFAGTGSECVVSKKYGFDFIGFDNIEDYVNLANKWLNTINNEEIKKKNKFFDI